MARRKAVLICIPFACRVSAKDKSNILAGLRAEHQRLLFISADQKRIFALAKTDPLLAKPPIARGKRNEGFRQLAVQLNTEVSESVVISVLLQPLTKRRYSTKLMINR